MVSPEASRSTVGEAPTTTTMASPRISFSSDFLDDDSFISISPGSSIDKDEIDLERSDVLHNNGSEFEFLSSKNSLDAGHHSTMLTADELFFEGKLLPHWQVNHAAEKLAKISLRASASDEDSNNADHGKHKSNERDTKQVNVSAKGNENGNMSASILLGREPQEPRIWFVDDDPSPRPPNCTVLFKELLRLKKRRSSTLSPSSSSSSTSSSSSSLGDAAANVDEKEKEKDKDKYIKKIKKGLERTRSATIRMRPMFNVPVSTQSNTKSSSLPPLFPLRKSKSDR